MAPHSPKARLVQRLWCLGAPLQPATAAGAGAQAEDPGRGRTRRTAPDQLRPRTLLTSCPSLPRRPGRKRRDAGPSRPVVKARFVVDPLANG
uniref:Putative secreted protein n=1 Tax=Ixodes ricinus TaxID=34613 RepID=A0A147BTE6_IXORI